MRDMLPVAGICQAPAVFAINSSVPAKTVTEFIAHAKANPGRINMGSAGIGSTGREVADGHELHCERQGGVPRFISTASARSPAIRPPENRKNRVQLVRARPKN